MGYASQSGRARTSATNPQAHAICDRCVSLYLITNSFNGKTYVGVTKHVVLQRRLSEHFAAAKRYTLNGHFQRALRKYDKSMFSIKLLAKYATRKEAYDAEIEYIKIYKPDYNSTLGGDGAKGHKSTEKVRKTNKLIHTGNKYRLGATHTPDVKERLKAKALENFEKFQEYMHLGPKKSSKPVICLDDGNLFSSASEAARFYNTSKSALIELCLGKNHRQTVKGLRFKYQDAA